jgi:hypothetical protein
MGAALLVPSCAAGPKSAETGEAPGAAPAGAALSAAPAKGGPLDSASFQGMPPEARAYLELLARAFIDQDENFLLAQGEAQFEAEVKPGCDSETYLALLYHAGAYAAESPRAGIPLPRLKPADIHHIEYTHWKENGPMLEIQGRLITRAGNSVPCKIMLVWRLREPKILGRFP